MARPRQAAGPWTMGPSGASDKLKADHPASGQSGSPDACSRTQTGGERLKDSGTDPTEPCALAVVGLAGNPPIGRGESGFYPMGRSREKHGSAKKICHLVLITLHTDNR